MKCLASEGGKCQLVIGLGEPCDGYSEACRMRPQVEQQERLARQIEDAMRRAFGIRGDRR